MSYPNTYENCDRITGDDLNIKITAEIDYDKIQAMINGGTDKVCGCIAKDTRNLTSGLKQEYEDRVLKETSEWSIII